jgi:predicted alpha-1,2-mannosidase
MKQSFANLLILTALTLPACTPQEKQPVDYVDPFIGTGFHGHTYPGATLPFGAVQLSPDTRKGNWDACAGYHYSDSTIAGFSHTHLSGTGCIDFGDILFQPHTGDFPAAPDGYRPAPLAFSHDDESALAGYYAVTFKREGIKAELTATTYAGLHRYTYDRGKNRNVFIDLRYTLGGDRVDSIGLRQTAESEIAGMHRTQGWTPNQYVFFVAQCSEPFQSANLTDSFGTLNFGVSEGKPIVIKVGLSTVSEENARENLLHDVPDFDFDAVCRKARETWNAALSEITVEGAPEADLKNFYTALYHTKVVPNIISDVNGQYRRQNNAIGSLPQNEKRYSTFSLWDTYRAWHPLVTLTGHDLVRSMINSFLDQYDATGELPIWPLSSGETRCMIGYHSVSVIADAYLKGIRGFNAEKALDAMVASSDITSTLNRKSPDYYTQIGYIPSDVRRESVSCLLEYACDDWCIAQIGEQNDITGLIGQYGHGNEPSHHMACLYNYAGQPWKTQAMVRRILKEMYLPAPEGIIGNEDCGQMSAWYILSSLGFYPVCPGSNQLLLTAPLFPKATVGLANGKTLVITANNPQQNTYIDRVTFNGKEITANYITYSLLMEGGTLEFTLSNRPNLARGASNNAFPYSLSSCTK